MPPIKSRDPNEVTTGSAPPTREQVQKEVALCTAAEKLTGSVTAMRMALEASDSAVGTLSMLQGNRHEGLDLRRRWVASSALLHGALAGVERDSKAVVDAVKALLTL